MSRKQHSSDGLGCEGMDIIPEDFERFLTWLDPDREQACRQYDAIRTKITRYFQCRGWGVDAEELVDETKNRVVIKMRELADSYVGDRLPYFYGVARRVHQERLKKRVVEEQGLRELRDLPAPSVSDSPEEEDQRDKCLRQCMETITPQNRDLILRYYVGDKGEKIAERKNLADELGIAQNALRIRAHRIRTDLRHCAETCVAEANND
jgi:RNA polymerase sigma factor (sigma-70 family)